MRKIQVPNKTRHSVSWNLENIAKWIASDVQEKRWNEKWSVYWMSEANVWFCILFIFSMCVDVDKQKLNNNDGSLL